MRIRVGLVGLGEAWEQRYAPALRALADRFEVRAVCDAIGHRAAHVAEQFGAVVVDGYHALSRREDVDAVLLLSPGWFGALPLLAASTAGKAVYCGADLNLELSEAETLRRRTEEQGIVFMAEFVRRYAPATLRLKELIATELGAPHLLFSHLRLGMGKKSAEHTSTTKEDTVKRELVELVDWCCYVVGKHPSYVSGMAHQRVSNHTEDDYRMLSLDFSDRGRPGGGAVAQVSCGRYIPARWHEAVNYRPLAELQVSCEKGVAFIDLPSTLVWFDEAGRHLETLDAERPVGEQLLTQFHHAVTNHASGIANLRDVHDALLIVHEAGRSFRDGHRVELG